MMMLNKEKFEEIFKNHYPKYLKYWEDILKANSTQEFLVGDSITIADFLIMAIYLSLVDGNQFKD